MNSPIIREIVKKNLCIGCGVCTAVCPSDSLKIEWNHYGEYNAVEKITCDKECGLCLKVCPFADGNDNEDKIGKTLYGEIPGIYHRTETGYYLNCYVGFAKDTRNRGASGGMATWLLSILLKKGIVDYVIAVVPNNDGDRLFEFTILSNPESVLDSSGSVYYPVELSGVLKEIQKNPGKYALIGLPCFIKAIRLAQTRNPILRQRIFITAGLTCGQLKSRYFTSYIAALAGIREGDLKQVHYREKCQDGPASNFYYSFTRKNGTIEKIFRNNSISATWVNRWFTLNSCKYCDDIFAECADVTFMDAWLPEYSEDSRGTSIVLVRSPLVQNVINRGITDEELNIDPIIIEKVVQNQAGTIDIKRKHLAYQLYFGNQKGLKMPKKRVEPSKSIDRILRQEIHLKDKMQRISREMWNPKDPDIECLHEKMRRLSKVPSIIIFPMKVIRYVQRKIRSIFYG
jgi:coenzyme F420 hydrogenase subunit beta